MQRISEEFGACFRARIWNLGGSRPLIDDFIENIDDSVMNFSDHGSKFGARNGISFLRYLLYEHHRVLNRLDCLLIDEHGRVGM